MVGEWTDTFFVLYIYTVYRCKDFDVFVKTKLPRSCLVTDVEPCCLALFSWVAFMFGSDPPIYRVKHLIQRLHNQPLKIPHLNTCFLH